MRKNEGFRGDERVTLEYVRKKGMRVPLCIVIALVLTGTIAGIASAGTVYLSGGPDIVAGIYGTNEFSPGETIPLTVVVENRGLIEMKIIRPDLVSRDDLPSTAKMVRVTLLKGNAPVTVKTDPQMLGEIAGGGSKTATFSVQIARDAPAGKFTIPLVVEYTYLYFAESTGQDNIRYYWKVEQRAINLSVNIRPLARLEIVEARGEHLNAGTEGYLTLVLRNAGNEPARNAVLQLTRPTGSQVIPTESSVYIGELPVGGVATSRIKVSVTSSAEGGQSYPLSANLKYEDRDGVSRTTDSVIFGVPIAGKIDFEVITHGIRLRPGEKKVIEVEFRNAGSATVYGAQARISAVDPFTSGDDTSYLGDLAPGETRIARFEVSADSSATPKMYGLDTEIRYRDALDNTLISGTMKVPIEVVQSDGALAALANPIVLSIIVVLIIGAAYFLYTRRRNG